MKHEDGSSGSVVASSWILPGLVYGLAFALIGASPHPSHADTWESPKPFEVYSSNSNFMARVEPAWGKQRGRAPLLTVFKMDDGHQSEHWQIGLSNDVSPVTMLVANDGDRVVAFDNWHSVGYGDDVVAFYGPQGLVQKYSLETALADLPEEKGSTRFRTLFSHSVSSRDWHQLSIELLDSQGAQPSFGIWLDWAFQWWVWRLSDGAPVDLEGDTLHYWREKGRQWARERLSAPYVTGRPSPDALRRWTPEAAAWSGRVAARYRDQITACRYLAYAKQAEDRPLLEALLKNAEEDVSWRPSVRIDADRALAIWDGVERDFDRSLVRSQPRFYRLGQIVLELHLPQAPAKGEGQIYFSIFPETVEGSEWRRASAVFRSGKSLRSSTATLDSSMELETPPLLPGRYWIKAVWDRTPPLQFDLFFFEGMRAWKELQEAAPTAEAGDFESGEAQRFEVRAGETTTVEVNCTRPGVRGQP